MKILCYTFFHSLQQNLYLIKNHLIFIFNRNSRKITQFFFVFCRKMMKLQQHSNYLSCILIYNIDFESRNGMISFELPASPHLLQNDNIHFRYKIPSRCTKLIKIVQIIFNAQPSQCFVYITSALFLLIIKYLVFARKQVQIFRFFRDIYGELKVRIQSPNEKKRTKSISSSHYIHLD